MAVLPFARPGIVSASMLGLGRALGETMAVAMVLSPSAIVSFALLTSQNPSTIAANIALSFPESYGLGVNQLIATGLVLFVITLGGEHDRPRDRQPAQRVLGSQLMTTTTPTLAPVRLTAGRLPSWTTGIVLTVALLRLGHPVLRHRLARPRPDPAGRRTDLHRGDDDRLARGRGQPQGQGPAGHHHRDQRVRAGPAAAGLAGHLGDPEGVGAFRPAVLHLLHAQRRRRGRRCGARHHRHPVGDRHRHLDLGADRHPGRDLPGGVRHRAPWPARSPSSST